VSEAPIIIITVEPCGTIHRMILRRPTTPGALVEVEINGVTTNVQPVALLSAALAVQD
jgi:hypothetical protein